MCVCFGVVFEEVEGFSIGKYVCSGFVYIRNRLLVDAGFCFILSRCVFV